MTEEQEVDEYEPLQNNAVSKAVNIETSSRGCRSKDTVGGEVGIGKMMYCQARA